jgi:hypothetical protein
LILLKKGGYVKKIALFILFACFICTGGDLQAAKYSSFDFGSDGWTTIDVGNSTYFNGVTPIEWINSGGNPNGYVSGEDIPQAGDTWFFRSPSGPNSNWGGDWTSYTGGSLSWDIIITSFWDEVEPPFLVKGALIIDAPGTGDFLRSNFISEIGVNSWTHFEITIISENFEVIGNKTFEEILSNVDKILIKGEYGNGPDSSGIDNVTLEHAHPVNPVPEPSTIFLLGSGLIGLTGYGRRKLKKN